MNYKFEIITVQTKNELAKDVEIRINKGWLPQGGPFLETIGNVVYFHQAMIFKPIPFYKSPNV